MNVYIARIRDGDKIAVEKYEVLSERNGSLVIKRGTDIRLFARENLGDADVSLGDFAEEGYGSSPEESADALKAGLKTKADSLAQVAESLRESAELPVFFVG